MSNTISLDDWLRVVDDEYLSTFIKDGGASIKFAVTPNPLKQGLVAAVNDLCRKSDSLLVQLDAAKLRAYMPQDIFFGLASQVDWRVLARRKVLELAKAKRYDVHGIDPNITGNIFGAIAKANWLEESDSVIRAIRPEIERTVSKNSALAKDFRVAMNHLCQREDTGDGGDYTGQPILDWLTGTNPRVGNIRPFSIYTSINRTTARYFIESALYWVHHVGYTGTVILLDNSRVTVARNPRDGLQYYSKSMATEHYELLREFIDSVDRLTGTLMLVVTNDSFLDSDPSSRGYGIYEALQTRVMDDVRDKNLVNPAASLVRLS